MLIQGCLNGARGSDGHPRLHPDLAVLQREAADAVAAGADVLHVHAKGADGADSLDGSDVDAWVAAVRRSCPSVQVSVTTGAWAAPTADRLARVATWTTLPDVASVNWHEHGAEDVAALLLERGVGVEAGLWNEDACRSWAVSRLRDRCTRAMIELPDLPPGEVTARAEALVALVREAAPGMSVLLHGEGRSTWPAIELAGRWSLDTRIGLEDCLTMPDGAVAPGNGALVAAAVRLYREAAASEDR